MHPSCNAFTTLTTLAVKVRRMHVTGMLAQFISGPLTPRAFAAARSPLAVSAVPCLHVFARDRIDHCVDARLALIRFAESLRMTPTGLQCESLYYCSTTTWFKWQCKLLKCVSVIASSILQP